MGNVRVWERSRVDAVTKETEANRKQSVGEFPAFSAQLRIVSCHFSCATTYSRSNLTKSLSSPLANHQSYRASHLGASSHTSP